jgi:hypothetical protein
MAAAEFPIPITVSFGPPMPPARYSGLTARSSRAGIAGVCLGLSPRGHLRRLLGRLCGRRGAILSASRMAGRLPVPKSELAAALYESVFSWPDD